MKIVFCWSDISGYMAACWRNLAARDGVEIHVLAYGSSGQTAFSAKLMDGLSWTALDERERDDADHILGLVRREEPDVLVLPGWMNRAFVRLTKAPDLSRIAFAMGMDTPWRGTPRQHLARIALRRYLRRISAVVVPGERAWQFARRLGLPDDRIHRGMYGVDWNGLGAAAFARAENTWPRSFLFAGRYAEEKGVDTLVEAYQIYRQLSDNPWDLQICGMGPLATLFQDQAGITDHGFLQPEATRLLMAKSGALVLPSRFDPWPLIVVEAAAAGLPLLVSESCGSAVELLRPGFNGIFVPPKTSASKLANGMLKLSSRRDLAEWGARSRLLAEAYKAETWADRWLAIAEEIVKGPEC